MTNEELLVRAFEIALKSPDPSTQVGAFLAVYDVVANPGEGVVIGDPRPLKATEGFNTFPHGVEQTAERWERPAKYKLVVHAEMHALLNCAKWGVSTQGKTMVLTWGPCDNCAKHIVAAGIRSVITHDPVGETHWDQSIAFGEMILAEGGVEKIRVKGPLAGAPAVRRDGGLFTP